MSASSPIVPRLPLPAVVLVLACLACPTEAMADGASPNPSSMSFAPGGTIRMTLKIGTMEVVGVPDDRIRVSWRSRFPEDERDVVVNLRRSGDKSAALDVAGPGEHMMYRIEVPRQSDVVIEMQAGELEVRGIQGSVDAELLAGEMRLGVADATRYRKVSAAVTAGEITASPWQTDISGLFRSFSVRGDGDYDLRARLLAGQLTIRAE